MQHYEVMYLVPGTITPEQLPSIQARVLEYVTKVGGQPGTQLELERRRLAYKIRQHAYAYYGLIQFEAEANVIRDLDQKIRLDNDVLRYMISLASPMTAEQIRVMMAGEKYKLHKDVPVVPVAAVKTSVTALTEEEKMFAETKQTKPEDEDAGKVSIEELDKKLDAILEDSDLASKL